jgi:hypothetical protein
MNCLACQLGLIDECQTRPGKGCKEKNNKEVFENIVNIIPPLEDEPKRSRAHKEPTQLLDPLSTGRKRARELLPILFLCEWAGLKYAGGGEFPIVGCDPKAKRKATNRHHGPDKDTTNNSRDDPRNLHGICTYCHNRWHALNDENYEYYIDDVMGELQPHDSQTRATDEEIRENELRFSKAKIPAATEE